jgi:hypothetical protein
MFATVARTVLGKTIFLPGKSFTITLKLPLLISPSAESTAIMSSALFSGILFTPSIISLYEF